MCGLMFIQNTHASNDVTIFQQNFIKDVSVGKDYLSIFFWGMFTNIKKHYSLLQMIQTKNIN